VALHFGRRERFQNLFAHFLAGLEFDDGTLGFFAGRGLFLR